MSEYIEQANNFLTKATAKIDIRLIGKMINKDWKEKVLRNAYDVTITTPRGTMNFIFWDSIYNTEIYEMSLAEYAKKRFKCEYPYLTFYDQRKASKELRDKKAEAAPNAYDVLACLTTYDVGSLYDFCDEFGYDEDSKTATNIYIAVVNEYKQLERIFTSEQMEELREIQ